jgi:respiratory-subunit NADH dehydrogenase subunit
MSDLATIPIELGLTETWTQKNGAQWISAGSLDVGEMARMMISRDARFVTITAMDLGEGNGVRLDYHWALDGELLTFTFTADEGRIASIYDLCPAADWIEREIHENFNVEFEGRAYEPLLVRPGDPLGMGLHKEDE